ncbi:hypothetical protein KM043_000105 [Ampulex compressa]|nr:hypothetical protein KM043_000105 [Ampulex compressa]
MESDGSGNPSPKKLPRIQELSSYQESEDSAENSPAPSRVLDVNMDMEMTAEIHAPLAELDSMHSAPTDEEMFTFKRKRSPDRKERDRKSQKNRALLIMII